MKKYAEFLNEGKYISEKERDLFLFACISLATKLYKNSEFIVKDGLPAGTRFIKWKNPQELGIERINSRNISSFKWISVEPGMSLSIGFCGYDHLLDEEVIEIPINKFLINIVEKYKWVGNLNGMAVSQDDVKNMVKEITLENYEFFSDVNKYNL